MQVRVKAGRAVLLSWQERRPNTLGQGPSRAQNY